MLGVDRVVLDRRVEPEAVAVLLAVVEGRLQRAFLRPAAASAAAAPAAALAGFVAVGVASASSSSRPPPRPRPLGLRVGLVQLGLDLGLDLVAQVDVAGGLLALGVEAVRLRKSRSCEAVTSSWWAIQASVRPWRTQARIWLSCGFSDLRAIGGRL